MSTFDPAEVRKAVAEFTPRRPQKSQVVEKPFPAVTNARIVPLRFTNHALVTSLHFQDSNKCGGLPSALGGGRCASTPNRYSLFSVLRSTLPSETCAGLIPKLRIQGSEPTRIWQALRLPEALYSTHNDTRKHPEHGQFCCN
jgi:hypothetical protein